METASMQQSKPNFTLQCRRFLAAVNRRAGQGRAGQGRAGQGRAGQSKQMQCMTHQKSCEGHSRHASQAYD